VTLALPEATSVQKRSDMACVFKGSYSFTCHEYLPLPPQPTLVLNHHCLLMCILEILRLLTFLAIYLIRYQAPEMIQQTNVLAHIVNGIHIHSGFFEKLSYNKVVAKLTSYHQERLSVLQHPTTNSVPASDAMTAANRAAHFHPEQSSVYRGQCDKLSPLCD